MQNAKPLPEIPLPTLLYATALGHLAYTVPTLGAFLLFDLTDIKPLLFVVLLKLVVSIPLLAALAWLVAKGAYWTNYSAAMVVACSVPAFFNAMLLGGWLGARLFGYTGGVVGLIAMFLVAYVTRFPLSRFITRRLLSTNEPHNWMCRVR